ncbi:Protein of unknown function [Modestobacter sp. DSM 44400]|uniref:DUF2567 domain-containing protein n=1 Tax=Modestobacter sp. DSM 44400 TaxID=1550230 RepID=UPI00089D5AB4|nr:DUF2567 domain-containing protein [Modestobacter sp. DSM 44400]SDX96100.1 Protein of unknown function [Modestobacter sp. DSM 44400]
MGEQQTGASGAGASGAGAYGAGAHAAGESGQSPAARPVRWGGLQGARADLRSGLLTVLALALAGLPAGLVWRWLAPRAAFRVTAGGVEPIGVAPSPELFMADDGVYVLVLATLGLLAGLAVWLLRRHRGVVVLAALAAGMIAAALVAWQLGQLVAASPTDTELAEVGGTVTTGLRLGAVAAVAVGPFVAVLTYLVATTLTSRDDLGRDDVVSQPAAVPAAEEQPAR